MARADLLKGLSRLIPSDRIHFGKRLMHIDVAKCKKVTLYFEDGTEASADCLIGADGIHSTTRSHLLGQHHPATPAKDRGWLAFRRRVPIEEASKTVDAKLLNKVLIYCGEGSVINCMPVHGGKTLMITVCYLKAGSWDEGKVYDKSVFRKEFFKDWISDVRDVVEVCSA